jgi:L,D-peptidoglycan transpeptidase YkuD (ErfK/YbiS/YcfS/YnhG family)
LNNVLSVSVLGTSSAGNSAVVWRTILVACSVCCALILSSCAFFVPGKAVQVECPTANVKQIVLVVTSDWNDSTGTLQTFERNRLGDDWIAASKAIPVDVGRNGLGWGVGLHGEAVDNGPVKREGDGKSPAGVFRISEVFGYASADSANLFKMPYEPLSSVAQCIDDAKSEYYNLLLDSLDVKNAHWTSNEVMRASDSLYSWGAFVDQNVSPRIPGRGSCIFLHIWEGPNRPTAGCTAMELSNLLHILHWLDPIKHPVLVQLPRKEYQAVWKSWNLPPPERGQSTE